MISDLHVVLIRRQSPDWRGLSSDYIHRRDIDPTRFVPDHEIEGFPENIESLIAIWNKRFAIDFFTYRSVLAELSRKSVEAIKRAHVFEFDDHAAVLDLTWRRECYNWFHDDDDFFHRFSLIS